MTRTWPSTTMEATCSTLVRGVSVTRLVQLIALRPHLALRFAAADRILERGPKYLSARDVARLAIELEVVRGYHHLEGRERHLQAAVVARLHDVLNDLAQYEPFELAGDEEMQAIESESELGKW